MAVINLIGKTMGGQDKRSKVTKIARHHSATTTGDVFSFENHWKGVRKWNTGGYHEVILRNGDVQLCYADNVVSNGVYGHNQTAYNICLVGNGSFTDAQEKAFDDRAKNAMKRFGLSASDVLGHGEFSGQNTVCPGTNMNVVRNRLKAGTSTSTPPKKETESTTTSKPKANLTVDGKWGNSTTEALQVALGTTVDGKLSDQLPNTVTNALYGSTARFGNGKKGSMVIKALQRKLGGLKADGLLGPATVKRLQSRLNMKVIDSKLSRPSAVVEVLQRRLNAGTF